MGCRFSLRALVARGEILLNIRLRVIEVKEDEVVKDHVMIWAVKDESGTAAEPKQLELRNRIIHVGPIMDDEQVTKQISQQIAESVRRVLPCGRRPMVVLSLYIPKHYFQMLGRPTIDDMIQIDARTIRQHY